MNTLRRRNMVLTPGGNQEFLDVVQILFCNFPNLLASCGVQQRISLILFKFLYTNTYLHVYFSTLKIPRGNILYIPFCTFPFSFRSTFWRIKEYLISAHLYLIFSHGVLEFIVHTIINHFPSSWKCRFFS